MWGICEVEVQGTAGPFFSYYSLLLLNLVVLLRLNKILQDLVWNIRIIYYCNGQF